MFMELNDFIALLGGLTGWALYGAFGYLVYKLAMYGATLSACVYISKLIVNRWAQRGSLHTDTFYDVRTHCNPHLLPTQTRDELPSERLVGLIQRIKGKGGGDASVVSSEALDWLESALDLQEEQDTLDRIEARRKGAEVRPQRNNTVQQPAHADVEEQDVIAQHPVQTLAIAAQNKLGLSKVA